MKKVILLSTVLCLGVMGMACGEAANTTNTAVNKPATTNVITDDAPAFVAP